MATGADPLHLAATFGLDPGTAVRYASSARQLLQTAAEELFDGAQDSYGGGGGAALGMPMRV